MKVDLEKITSSKLKEMKARQLDEKFKKKYPNGQYRIQIRGRYQFNGDKELPTKDFYIELAIQYRRKTSCASYYCPVVYYNPDTRQMKREKFVNNSWGFVRYFDNENAFIKTCDKHNIPKEVVKELLLYNLEFKERI